MGYEYFSYGRRHTIKEYLIWDTVYSVQGLTDEVSPHGFTVREVFDDVCGNPYTGEAETLCVVFKKFYNKG